MTKTQYEEFSRLREEFRRNVQAWSGNASWLLPLQRELAARLGYGDYEVETPVVYNKALDDVGPEASPAFLIVADNPGKNEQRKENQRYLVGQSGRLAQGWFSRELGVDFRSAAVVINKTPLHTPKTAELRLLRTIAAESSPAALEGLDALLEESQKAMAELAFRLHACLGGVLWVSGYGELRKGKLFHTWAGTAKALYGPAPQAMRRNLWVFKHFSMNQFSMEYNRARESSSPREAALDTLARIGSRWRSEILDL